MSKKIKPTSAELEILLILWDKGPSSVREVHEQLTGKRDVFYTTVLKTMQVMTEKGLLERDTTGRAHIYEASIARDEVEKNLITTLSKNLFKGSVSRLVISALGHDTPTDEELAEIRKMIDKLDSKTND